LAKTSSGQLLFPIKKFACHLLLPHPHKSTLSLETPPLFGTSKQPDLTRDIMSGSFGTDSRLKALGEEIGQFY